MLAIDVEEDQPSDTLLFSDDEAQEQIRAEEKDDVPAVHERARVTRPSSLGQVLSDLIPDMPRPKAKLPKIDWDVFKTPIKEKVRKDEREAPKAWFGMKSAPLSEETKKDLDLLRLRGTLDSKRFYKREDSSKGYPKFFQVGTVISGSQEFYSARLSKKEQANSLVEELLSDRNQVRALKSRVQKLTASAPPRGSLKNKKLSLRRKRNREVFRSEYNFPDIRSV
jgi:hypothetical protein